MTKEALKELNNENTYILNMMALQRGNMEERMSPFFEPIKERIRDYGFIYCIHTHTKPATVSIYNSIENGIDYLQIQLNDFDIINVSDNFPEDVLKILEDWLEGLE